jgi:hypothetical protein
MHSRHAPGALASLHKSWTVSRAQTSGVCPLLMPEHSDAIDEGANERAWIWWATASLSSLPNLSIIYIAHGLVVYLYVCTTM